VQREHIDTGLIIRADNEPVRMRGTVNETLRIRGWGTDTFRVEASPTGQFTPIEEALVRTTPTSVTHEVSDGETRLINGKLTAVVERSGRVSFRSTTTGEELMGEPWFDPNEPPWHPHRRFLPIEGGRDSWTLEATFAAYENERIYGLGQHTLGQLDLKGHVIDLLQRNSQIAVPVLVSSRGYGMFWNCPSIGRVELAENRTRWVAERASQLDYFVYSGDTPAAITERYAELTGFSPPMPSWATGYWQSNSFYPTQDELLAVARKHRAKGLPLAAIFVDYMHWTHLGNYDWDREAWPDPAAMVAELQAQGIRTMVAVWPHISPLSDHHQELLESNLLVSSPSGRPAVFSFADRARPEGIDLSLLDLTQPAAREFLWSRLRENHYDIGVDTFWLDACEPELTGDGMSAHESTARFSTGEGTAVSSMFPLYDVRAIREGLAASGSDDSVMLVRSAWAGSQRYGAAVWSGDIPSTWASLRLQIGAGLNMMASGLPWWTSDIGGFYLAEPESDSFRELLVRWFQFGVFWPILRMHGNRHPNFYNAGIFSVGGPNEIWSFGPEAEEHLTKLLFFRERLRPYLQRQLDITASHGTPPVRPLWFEFPSDHDACQVDDQFLLGSDLLVAPIAEYGSRERQVYLPAGRRWRNVWSGAVHEGGQTLTVAAPLEQIPIFEIEGGELDLDASWFTVPAPQEATGEPLPPIRSN
jgi:alpha-D-xyloside xylohydrolase